MKVFVLGVGPQADKGLLVVVGAHDSHPPIMASSWFDFQEMIPQVCLDVIAQHEESGCFSSNWVFLLPSVASSVIPSDLFTQFRVTAF